MIRILVVDDHELVRRGLRGLLKDAFPDLVIGHFQARAGRHLGLVLGIGSRGLFFAEAVQVFRLGRVMAVAVDDHGIPGA